MAARKPPWGLLAAGVLLALVVAGFLIPAGLRSHAYCRQCGLYLQTRTVFGLTFRSEETNGITGWYARRIGRPHDHAWAHTSCSGMITIWQTTAGYACGRPDPYARITSHLPAALARLEPLGLDLSLHRELNDSREGRREGAAKVAEFVDGGWTDDQVRAWWSDAQAWMDGPRTGSFEEFRRSRRR